MRSLFDEIKNRLNLDQNSKEFFHAYAESVLYLCGVTTAFEYQKYVKPYCTSDSAKVFRLRLQNHGYTNLNIKLFTLRLVKGRESFLDLKDEFSIHRNDSICIKSLLENTPWFRSMLKKLASSINVDHDHLNVSGVNKTFNSVYPPVYKYIKHLVYKKLRFVSKSTNTSLEDFHSSVIGKVVQSYHSMIPVHNTDEYIVNYLKQVAHNYIINLIKMHTTQKRGRLVSVGSGYSLLCVSQNQFTPILNEDGEEISGIDGVDESNERLELTFSVSEVLDKFKASTKKYRFITILLGSEDNEFSHWLRNKKLCKPSEDNVDLQMNIPALQFNKYVADFLDVAYDKVERFLNQLKQDLALV